MLSLHLGRLTCNYAQSRGLFQSSYLASQGTTEIRCAGHGIGKFGVETRREEGIRVLQGIVAEGGRSVDNKLVVTFAGHSGGCANRCCGRPIICYGSFSLTSTQHSSSTADHRSYTRIV